MLDKRTKALLDIINKECVNSGYKVLEINDLVASMPTEFGIDKEGVVDSINTLSEKEFVSVKYLDEIEVCLSPLPKGRLDFEKQIEEQIEKKDCERRYFLFSFLGGMVGGLLVGIIFTLIFLFGGR